MFWITGILGALLAVSPWWLKFAGNNAATWFSVILGVIAVIASVIGGRQDTEDKKNLEYWVLGITGLVAFLAPFVFGYSALVAALWTGVIIGLILLVWDGIKVFQVRASHQH